MRLFFLRQIRVSRNEVDVFYPLVRIGFQLCQTFLGAQIDLHSLFRVLAHIGEIHTGDDIAAMEILPRRYRSQIGNNEPETQIRVARSPKIEGTGVTTGAKKNHDRNHPLRIQKLGNIQTITGKPMDGKLLGSGFLFQEEQNGLSLPLREFHQ